MQETVNILLVDDQTRNLDALEAILSEPSYRLLRANGADQALHVLLEEDVAAIVLDIKMPGVGGLELAHMIKGTKKFRQIPIVFLTAHMMGDQDVISGYGAGAVDYLTKPVNPLILRHKIAVFAELCRKTRTLAELNETLEARVQARTADLERSEVALRAAARQKDEFIATLAHELRNPLAPLRLGLDRLVQSHAPSPEASRTLTIMNRQLDHMVRLIDDLLDVARINGGMLELHKERLDVAGVIQTAIEANLPFFEKRRQTISVEGADSLFVFADATRLLQVVGNLLHNASKFGPEGGQLRVEISNDDGDAIVRVIDSGVGIPVDQIDRVFDMFARVERVVPHSSGGLGIGLAVSRRLAELHGGALTVSSSGEGHGSTFTLSIPAGGETMSTGKDDVARMPRNSTQITQQRRILVIEDNEDTAEALAEWLRDSGYVVEVAHTGPAGLTLLQTMRPDVVLCDIGLPGMDGIEVCRRVRSLLLDFRPVMIALTGWGMAEDRRRTQEAGFDQHLVKPVEPASLKTILESLEHGAGQRV